MTTVRDVLVNAVNIIRAYGAGEDPTNEDLQLAFKAFNSMRANMSTMSLIHPSVTLTGFTWPANQSVQTIGPAGQLIANKPITILSAFTREGDVDLPVEICTFNDYNSQINKSTSGDVVSIAYNPKFSSSLGEIHISYVPTKNTNIFLSYRAIIAQYASINDLYNDPPGYEEAMTYNLVLRLAPMFGASLSAITVDIARESLANIKRQNINNDVLELYHTEYPRYPFGAY